MSTLYPLIIKVIWKDFSRNFFFFTQLCDFRENRPYTKTWVAVHIVWVAAKGGNQPLL